jgi:hypothetical protein
MDFRLDFVRKRDSHSPKQPHSDNGISTSDFYSFGLWHFEVGQRDDVVF